MGCFHYRLGSTVSLKPQGIYMSHPLSFFAISGMSYEVLRAISHDWLDVPEILDTLYGANVPTGVEKRITRLLSTLITRQLVDCAVFPDPTSHPDGVSIIIPVWNRADKIGECLEGLLQQSVEFDWEIVLVNDGSTDHTEEIVRHFLRSQDKIITLPLRGGPAAARNIGAEHARYPILVFIDSDCVPDADWLNELAGPFQDSTVAAVGGRIHSIPDSRITLAIYELSQSPLDLGTKTGFVGPGKPIRYVITANLAVRANAFWHMHGFRSDWTVGEDVDFSWRLSHNNSVWYQPSALVRHHSRTTWSSFLMRRAQYASSEARLERAHPDLSKNFPMSIGILALVSIIIAGIVFPVPYALGYAGLWAAIEGGRWIQWQERFRRYHVFLPLTVMAKVRGRMFVAWTAEWSLLVARYRSGILLALGVFCLVAAEALGKESLVLPGMILTIGCLIVYVIAATTARAKRSSLNSHQLPFLQYLGIFMAEMLSYQAGLWWGAFRFKNLQCLIIHPTSKSTGASKLSKTRKRRRVKNIGSEEPTN